jgi:hypothetical protein
MFEDCFIAVYTNECKSYCDELFFNTLLNSNIEQAKVSVIDNSITGYVNRLKILCNNKAEVNHIDVSRENQRTLFLRNVTESLLKLREQFLSDSYKYFIILESDVIPKDIKWLNYFMGVIDKADIIGGLYYRGFHSDDLFMSDDLVNTHHVLSGCTLYKREIIEKYPFRWDVNNLDVFPDAWMCYDAHDYRIANYCKIKCDHIHKENGSRGLELLK